jgi:ligand-binding SRPBCC domain-containing protein
MDKLATLSPEKWKRIAENPATYPFAGDAGFSTECQVKAPLDEVAAFFSKPANVRELTPPRFDMSVLEGDGDSAVEAGRNVFYRTRTFGVPGVWQAYFPHVWNDPGSRGFIDIRTGGVFSRWCHVHRFESLPSGGTRVLDDLRWRLALLRPIGWVGELVVEQQVRMLFRYREKRLDELFGLTRGTTR